MRGDGDDASAHRDRATGRSTRPASPGPRTLGLVAGFVLAVVATLVVFLTDDARVLRLAVVAAAWAFVLAALAASRRPPDGAPGDAVERADLERAAAEREAELPPAYELALEREVAVRREHELRLEHELRRTVEQSVRGELEALRTELASVGELRREVAEIAALRRDLAGLAELRAALAGLDPTALAELRTDVGRLRTELGEQLSGEMLVERVTLRTQSTRSAPEPTGPRTVEADSWTSPAPELTTAWPVARAEEPPAGTRQLEEVRVEPRRAPAPPPPPPPPLDWLASRSLLTPPASSRPEAEPGRRRTDAPAPTAALPPDETLTTERPVAQRERPPVPGTAVPMAEAPTPAEEDGGRRLADLLAERGLTRPSGGRRRRRQREDDGSDDVLARLLGR
ncbi:DUF6779 domain-containing protein [Geodermatophilus sp. URMC 61]|uniref:DUF6779 domain-containing protein n=1 Tax=Geodermatophilus sp. URMC 61 TaxID=3423411 RepID=UPI00406D3E90